MNGSPRERKATKRLGSYEIVRTLARGGMAELFLARTVGPLGFEKIVVLKKILPHLAVNPKFVRLFLDEAKLAAGFDHPHIAQVYDMGTVDGDYFFTMEYVHGQDLRSILKRCNELRRRLPIEHVVLVARNVAAALHYAHERRGPDQVSLGVIHRDVSPSNILLSYEGAVKLLDFGVAKAATSSMKTRTGSLKGKVSYMSPEHGRGAPVDRRTDIYSLGIVLWEMVTGKRMYRADNDLATIQMIINEPPPPPSQHRPDCPKELEAIVMRALAHSTGERYQTARQLELDLEELAREHKLAQSTSALGAHMHHLFAAELDLWHAAEATGVTLTDHVAALPDDRTASDGDDADSMPGDSEHALLGSYDEPADNDLDQSGSDAGVVDDEALTPMPTRVEPSEPATTDTHPTPRMPRKTAGTVLPLPPPRANEDSTGSGAAYRDAPTSAASDLLADDRDSSASASGLGDARSRGALWIGGTTLLALGVIVTIAVSVKADDPVASAPPSAAPPIERRRTVPVEPPRARPAAPAPDDSPAVAAKPVPIPRADPIDEVEPEPAPPATRAVEREHSSRSRDRGSQRRGGKRSKPDARPTKPDKVSIKPVDPRPEREPAKDKDKDAVKDKDTVKPEPKPKFDPKAALPPP